MSGLLSALLGLILAGEPPWSGPRPPDRRGPVRAVATEELPVIDGRLDEAAWQSAEVLTDFVQAAPAEGSAATEPTSVRVLYGRKALYLGFRCQDSRAASLRPRLTRRDGIGMTDWVGVALDTTHDRRNAYVFILTSAGTRVDGIMSEGGGDVPFDWDGIWEGRTTVDGQGWSAEMEIPFSTVRFRRAPEQRWGIFVRRRLARNNEMSDWSPGGRFDPAGVPRALGPTEADNALLLS